MTLHWTRVVALGVCCFAWTCGDEQGSGSCTDVGCVGGMSVWIESGGAWPAGSYQLALEQPGWARECNFELPLEPTSDGRIAAAALGCTPALDLAVVAETSCGRPSNPVVGDCVPLPEHYRIEGLIREQLTGALSVRLERGGVTLVDESRPLVYTELRPNGPGCAPVCEGTNVEVMLPSE